MKNEKQIVHRFSLSAFIPENVGFLQVHGRMIHPDNSGLKYLAPVDNSYS